MKNMSCINQKQKTHIVTLPFREAIVLATKQNFLRDIRYSKQLKYSDWNRYKHAYLWDTASLFQNSNKNYHPDFPDVIHYHVTIDREWIELNRKYKGDSFLNVIVELIKNQLPLTCENNSGINEVTDFNKQAMTC